MKTRRIALVSALIIIPSLLFAVLPAACASYDLITAAGVMDISDRGYEPVLIDLLDGAKESIVISMYDITLGEHERNPVKFLLKDLLEARERGVSVTMYLNTGFHEEAITPRKLFKNEFLKELQDAGCVIHSLPSYPRHHDKLVIIDGRYILEGSSNWSIAALKSNHESSSLILSPELAEIKLARLKALPLEARVKRPPKAQYLKNLPKSINVPKALLQDKKYFPQMVTSQDSRAMDLYLLLIGHSQYTGKSEFSLNLADMGVSLGMPDSWKNDAIRRQVIKSLKKLENEYSLLHVTFSHTKNAWLELAEIPGDTFAVEPLSVINPGKKIFTRRKILLLINDLLESQGEDPSTVSDRELAKRFHISYWSVRDARNELGE